MTPLYIDNITARRLILDVCALTSPPSRGPTLDAAADTVETLGMVQLDPIRTVARAHDHILWSRNNQTRPPAFGRLIEHRRVFEHFSHDAVILPMSMWPFWQRQRVRRAQKLERGSWGQALPSARERTAVLKRIAGEGPLSSRDFERAQGKTETWSKPPHKVALDWLWLNGTLAVSHRRGFLKHYDLAEHVIPADILRDTRSDEEQMNHLHRAAMQRLGMANAGQLKRFWDASTLAETRAWIESHADEFIAVNVEGADGCSHTMLAPLDVEDRIANLARPENRIRIINPFDPLVRDRTRLARLFGFDFRIEIYVPARQRRHGYYVYPLLEGHRFIGRAELRADLKADRLDTPALWLEPGIRWGQGRLARVNAEVARFARLAGVSEVGALPTPRPSA